MPKAKDYNIMSRRGLLATIGAIPAAILCRSAMAAAGAVDRDGVLGLCHAYHEICRSLKDLPDASARELEVMLDRKYELIGLLAEAGAKTPDEIAAKARIVREHLPEYLPVFDAENDNPEIRLALSLTNDTITFAESKAS